jgi:hypothetical protein
MQQHTSQILYGYWNEVRGPRVAPRRFEIEPSRITSILPETFILERQGAASYCFRLAGTRICDQFAQELRNRDVLDVVPALARLTLEDRLGVIAAQGAVGVFEFETVAGDCVGRCEMIVLPLTDARDMVTRFLGAISPIRGNWLGTGALSLRALVRDELIWPDGRPYPLLERGRMAPVFRPTLPTSRVVKANEREFRVFDGGLARLPRTDQ